VWYGGIFVAFLKNLNFYVPHFSPNFLDKKKKVVLPRNWLLYCANLIAKLLSNLFFYFSFIKKKDVTHSLAILKGTELEKFAAWFLFFVIVWKLIQDSRYDREPIFQFALLLFADLLPFNTVMAVRYLQQLINQNYKNQIYSTESCLKT
jgi:hypothetical protein